MTNKETLEYLIKHHGDCSNMPDQCSSCSVYTICNTMNIHSITKYNRDKYVYDEVVKLYEELYGSMALTELLL